MDKELINKRAQELLEYLCMYDLDIEHEFAIDELTINETRSGEDVIWFLDERENAVIEIDTGIIWDGNTKVEDAWIDKELC